MSGVRGKEKSNLTEFDTWKIELPESVILWVKLIQKDVPDGAGPTAKLGNIVLTAC
jgi:hypothetical protein